MSETNDKQRKHNRRYYKRQLAIFAAFLGLFDEDRGHVTVGQIANAAGMPRQTFYRYFKNTDEALAGIKQWLRREYERQLDGVSLDGTNADINRRLFKVTFVFMAQYNKIFYQICSNIAVDFMLYRMLEVLYPKLRLTWLTAGTPTSDIDNDRVDLYLRHLTGVICHWVKRTHCDIDKAQPYIRRMIWITENAMWRNYY